MSPRSDRHRKAAIYVTESEYGRLSNLAESHSNRGASLLAEALARAIVVYEGEFPRRFVRLNSRVEYSDPTSGRVRRVQIVPPDEADIDSDRLSVLSPVGAALIGLSAGDSVKYSMEDGRSHVLVVANVEGAHETA